jgi:hypothetical protein
MNNILDFKKAEKLSSEDNKKWRADHITGENERIEIRKSFGGVQIVVIVYKKRSEEIPKHPSAGTPEYENFDWFNYWKKLRSQHKDIQISMNGKLSMTFAEYEELKQVVSEAQNILSADTKSV